MAEFVSRMKATSTKQPFQIQQSAFLPTLVKDAFSLQSLLLLGAAAQSALCAILPVRLAVTPTVLALLVLVIDTSLVASGVLRNKQMDGVVPGKVSARFPARETGRFGSDPASKPVVVFFLGVKFNHALGYLGPGVSETTEWFKKMNVELSDNRDEMGCLGSSVWSGRDRGDTNMINVLYYFRDLDGLNKFAHSDVHRAGWDWFNKKKFRHIGIMHEAFSVPAGAYESIYVNCQPTHMGAINMKVHNEGSGNDEWASTLVDASKGPLRSQFGRMGKTAGAENEKYGAEIDWVKAAA